MHFSSAQRVSDGVVERAFTLNDVPGILWTPEDEPASAPLVLLGHPGGLQRMYPRLAERARHAGLRGWAAATLELPWSGERSPSAAADAARAELQHLLRENEPVPDELVDRLVVPLVDAAVPEWQALVDALQGQSWITGPVFYSGGFIAIGTRLLVTEPRIAAAVLFAGSYVPRSTFEEARRVTAPLLVLLQWDDEGNDRTQALSLFDAFGSPQKTLHANLGGHTGVPSFEGEDAMRFLTRHLP